MTDTVDLLPTEVEADLRGTVRDLLADRLDARGIGALNALYDGDRAVVAPLWRALAVDVGLAGLLVPEDEGGAGASAREAAAVLEELGRAVAPVPFLTSAVLATTVLLGSGAPLLAELASGERTAALVVPWSTAPHAAIPTVSAGDVVTSVAGALEADVLLVPVAAGDRIALHAVPAEEAELAPVTSLDMTRQLADVRIGSLGEVLIDDAEGAIRRGLTATVALLASEQVGVARWCLEETTAYLKVRTQFGRVLGGFQALKHRLADLYAEVESGSAAAAYAAAVLADALADVLANDGVRDQQSDLPVATALAASYCGDLAVRASEEALQLHGGIGMTWEHPTHLRLKRAKSDQIALGTPGAHRAHLAGLVDL
ncbi:MAG: acyl-CoA dehydrogenase family protein [Marmoricola sp.]